MDFITKDSLQKQREESLWLVRYYLSNARSNESARKERLAWISLAHDEIKELKRINRLKRKIIKG